MQNNKNLRGAKKTFFANDFIHKGLLGLYTTKEDAGIFFCRNFSCKAYFEVTYTRSGLKPEKGFNEPSGFCPAWSEGLKGTGLPSV